MKKLVMILALTVLLSACGNSETAKKADNQTTETTNAAETVKKEAKKTTYATYNGEGFSLSYPESWKSVDTSQMTAAVKAAFSDQSPGKKFADNLNLTVEANTSGSVNPEDFANNTANYYEQNGASIGISNYKKTNFSIKPYKELNAGVLEGSYTHSSGTDVVLAQYMIPTNTDLYTLTLTYAKDTYSSDEVNDILNSLNITSTLSQKAPTTSAVNSSSNATTADVFKGLTSSITSESAVMEQVSYNFFAKHTDLFPASTAELRKKVKGLVDTKVTTRHLNKNLANYYENFVQIRGQVLQVEEDNSLGSTFSVVLLADEHGNYITAVYPATTGDLLDGDNATVIGVPIANYSFNNVGGGFTNSTLIGASLVTAE